MSYISELSNVFANDQLWGFPKYVPLDHLKNFGGLFHKKKLTIWIEVITRFPLSLEIIKLLYQMTIYWDLSPPDYAQAAQNARNQLGVNLLPLLSSADNYSDLTVLVAGTEYREIGRAHV